MKSCNKNYQTMKKKLATIWAIITLVIICSVVQSCNVTRTMTTKSEFFQSGDTTITITTKTTEMYNAEKKLY